MNCDINNNYNYNSDYFVVNRTLPKKIPGYEIYMNVPWTDIAIQNIPRENIGKNTKINSNIQITQNGDDDDKNKIIINDTYTFYKNTPKNIVSGETIWKKEKGESKFIRNRKIPNKKCKKYPTKKKNNIDYEIKNSRFDKYNMMNNYGN
jgi:hypothetical protein